MTKYWVPAGPERPLGIMVRVQQNQNLVHTPGGVHQCALTCRGFHVAAGDRSSETAQTFRSSSPRPSLQWSVPPASPRPQISSTRCQPKQKHAAIVAGWWPLCWLVQISGRFGWRAVPTIYGGLVALFLLAWQFFSASQPPPLPPLVDRASTTVPEQIPNEAVVASAAAAPPKPRPFTLRLMATRPSLALFGMQFAHNLGEFHVFGPWLPTYYIDVLGVAPASVGWCELHLLSLTVSLPATAVVVAAAAAAPVLHAVAAAAAAAAAGAAAAAAAATACGWSSDWTSRSLAVLRLQTYSGRS